ncbi:hypothetical protein CENSYa_1933 [Cenarchaeum symbiosum A]|uniref:Uncharacterized protein n=1 Tax=Cenarchaeum symbiosum (strain A) TaxID=414004 RepID=A0RYX4_CENSY|nr:hypothetical protein CENSYa_1933 [Cenarchaeum symbiosum A]
MSSITVWHLGHNTFSLPGGMRGGIRSYCMDLSVGFRRSA